MIIYHICLIMPLCFHALAKKITGIKFVFLGKEKTVETQRMFAWFIFLFFLLVSAGRDISVGTDLGRYTARFQIVGKDTWSNLVLANKRYGFEYGYLIFTKLLYMINPSIRFYIFATSIIIQGALFYAILKYSKAPCISYYIYTLFGFYQTSLNLTRLFMALVILLFAIEAIEKRRPIVFALIVLLAASFHTSALAFMPVYPICRKRITPVMCLLYLGGSAATYVLGSTILRFVFSYFSLYGSRYGDSIGSGDGEGMFVLLLGIFIICYIWREHFEKSDTYHIIWISILMLAIVYGSIALNLIIAARIMWYEKAILLFLIPNVLSALKGKNAFPIKLVFLCGSCMLPLIYYFSIMETDNFSVIPYIWGL